MDDGDDVWDEFDKYGICFNRFNCRAALTYFNMPVIALNESGKHEVVLYNDRTEEIYSALYTYIHDNDYVYLNLKGDSDVTVTTPMFMEDRLLFLPATLKDSQTLRSMDGSFGILPLPKYDILQENYYTHANDSFNVFMIPAQTADLEYCGTVLDALSAESKYSVIPTFYDVVLKGRTTKDEQSIAMLDLIRDNLYFDFGLAHTSSLGNIWSLFGQTLSKGTSTSFKSSYDSNASIFEEKLATVIESYKKLD